MEGKVWSVFNRVGVSVNPDDIEACHRLYNDKKQLPNFQNVNFVSKFCEKRRNWKTLNLASLIFRKAQLYLSMKVCAPITKCYGNKCKKLWEKKLIYTILPQMGIFDTGLGINGSVHTVTHNTGFKKNFPDIDINDL